MNLKGSVGIWQKGLLAFCYVYYQSQHFCY